MRLLNRPLAPGNDCLPDGRRVWWQRTEFDCFICAIATALQVPYDELPPPPIDASEAQTAQAEARLIDWLQEQDLKINRRPLNNKLGAYSAWIGLALDPDPAYNHSVVCDRNVLIFDPALAAPVPAGCHVAPTTHLNLAYTFDPTGDAA